MDDLEGTLKRLFLPNSHKSLDGNLNANYSSKYAVDSVLLTVIAFAEHFTSCVLYDVEVTLQSVCEVANQIRASILSNPTVMNHLSMPMAPTSQTSSPLPSILQFPASESYSSFSSLSSPVIPEPIDEEKKHVDDIFSCVIQQALYLLQQTTDSAAKSLLILSRCQLDMNMHCFQGLLLVLLQRDISMWCVQMGEESSPSNCFMVDNRDEMQMICKLSGGDLLTSEVSLVIRLVYSCSNRPSFTSLPSSHNSIETIISHLHSNNRPFSVPRKLPPIHTPTSPRPRSPHFHPSRLHSCLL